MAPPLSSIYPPLRPAPSMPPPLLKGAHKAPLLLDPRAIGRTWAQLARVPANLGVEALMGTPRTTLQGRKTEGRDGPWLMTFGLEDLPTTLDRIAETSPRYLEMINDVERLRQERIDANETGLYGEAFAIQILGDRTYCSRRVYRDRKTQLADGVVFRSPASDFAMVHELTHALPLDVLAPELAVLPYTELHTSDIDPTQHALDEVFHLLIHSTYQDEAISGLAEILYYLDCKAKRRPLTRMAGKAELQWLKQAARIYQDQGPWGYLQSELYIGRNHRKDYNLRRFQRMALVITMQPRYLADPNFEKILGEQGMKVGVRGDIGKALQAAEKAQAEGTPQAIAELLTQLDISVDPERAMERIREAARLVSGQQVKARASFLGQRLETVQRIGILGEVRRQLEQYTTGLPKTVAEIKRWFEEDPDKERLNGLIGAYRLVSLYQRGACTEDRTRLQEHYETMEFLLQLWCIYDAISVSAKIFTLFPDDLSLKTDCQQLRKALLQLEVECKDSLFRTIAEGLPESGNVCLAECIGAFAKKVSQGGSYSDSYWWADVLALDRICLLGEVPAQKLRDKLLLADIPEGGINERALLIAAERLPQFSPPTPSPRHSEQRIYNYEHDTMASEQETSPIASYLWALATWRSYALLAPWLSCLPTSSRSDPAFYPFQLTLIEWYFLRGGSNFPHPHELCSKTGAAIIDSGESLDPASISLGPFLDQLGVLGDINRGRRPSTRIMTSGEVPDGMLEVEPPCLYPVSKRVWDAPEGVPVIEDPNPKGREQFYYTTALKELLALLIDLRLAQAKHTKFEETIRTTLITEQMREITTFMEEKAFRDQKSDPSVLWVFTVICLEWIKLATQNGEHDWALACFDQVMDSIWTMEKEAPEIFRGIATAARAKAECTRHILPVHAAKDPEARGQALRDFLQRYQVVVEQRRAGLGPASVLMEIATFVTDRAYRSECIAITTFAIQHTVQFRSGSREFRQGFHACVEIIESAHFIHEDKDRLLGELMEGVLPARLDFTAQRLKASEARSLLNWFSEDLLSPEFLDRLPLYPRAETIVLDRSQALLREVSAMPLSPQDRALLLPLGFRIAHAVLTARPELGDASLHPRLRRVSDDPHYQAALVDLFPSQASPLKAGQAVELWNVALVRRGLDDPQAAWTKLRESLEASLTLNAANADIFAARVLVWSAFCESEIARSGKATDVMTETLGLLRSYRQRQAEDPDDTAPSNLSGTLAVYASMRRILDDSEQVLLNDLAQIPCLAWILQRLQAAWTAARSLSEREANLVEAMLVASSETAARQKREVALLALSEQRLPITVRRQAARTLAHASQYGQVLDALVSHFEKHTDAQREEQFYQRLLTYWQRMGQIPDRQGQLLLFEEWAEGDAVFWNSFDRVMGGTSLLDVASQRDLELLVLTAGQHGTRFLSETEQYAQSPNPERLNLVYGEVLRTRFPLDGDERATLLPQIAAVRRRQDLRQMDLDILRWNLPEGLVGLPLPVRFFIVNLMRELFGEDTAYSGRDLHQDQARTDRLDALCQLARDLGLDKLLQRLETMVGLVPDAARERFAASQENVPPSSDAECRETVRRSLGLSNLNEVFADWDDTPLASASMSDVNRARLRDGRDVIVKVGVRSKKTKNERLIAALSVVAEAFEREADLFDLPFDPAAWLRRFAKSMGAQTDFRSELKNARAFHERGYDLPDYEAALCTKDVLVMSPIEGKSLREIIDGGDTDNALIATNFARAAMQMLLIDGEIHADPHPGNARWQKNDTLGWLDWGWTSRISFNERTQLVALFVGVYQARPAQEFNAVRQIIENPESLDEASLLDDFSALPQAPAAARLEALVKVLTTHRIRLRPEMAEYLFFILMVNGVCTALDPQFDLAPVIMQVLQRLAEQQSPTEKKLESAEPEATSPQWQAINSEVAALRAMSVPHLFGRRNEDALRLEFLVLQTAAQQGRHLEQVKMRVDRLATAFIPIDRSYQRRLDQVDRIINMLADAHNELDDLATYADVAQSLHDALPEAFQGDCDFDSATTTADLTAIHLIAERMQRLRYHLAQHCDKHFLTEQLSDLTG